MLDLIVNPFITILLMFYGVLGSTFWSIVGFTVVIRLATLPLTLRQQRSLKAMQEVQPQLRELQDKYKNDREMLMQKQLELYREHKVNPMASCLPLFIQLPILLGLFRAIIGTLAATPGELLSLSDRIMDNLLFIPLPNLDYLVPMDNQFLWLNLAVPDQYFVLPVLVVITTFLQQKLLTPPAPKRKPGEKPSDDPSEQAAAMTRQMTTFMPIMFGFFALTYSSGLSIYFVTSNLIGIAQYTAMGKADFKRLLGREELSDEEKEILEKGGRLRLDSIADTKDSELAVSYEDNPERGQMKRSARLKLAKEAARRVRIDA